MLTGRRSIRIANCSGAAGDPGDHMLAQAVNGPVDVITGDYLAEANLAWYSEGFAPGKHPGWVPTAFDGFMKSLDAIHAAKIKVVINGGGVNPKGLAEEVQKMARERNYDLKIAYVDGDNLLPRINEVLKPDSHGRLPRFDVVDGSGEPDKFINDPSKPIVTANAYLGCRAIRRGLDEGADIIICGRVADASPVMGAAQWWHGWSDDHLDELAGALLAGHLIECSTYVTGGNFAGFDKYDVSCLLNLGLPIAEIAANGDCVITKHDRLKGIVTEETVKCQLLYELQGNVYLNSDVKADITNVTLKSVGENRVHVSGAKGFPPPPTTKLAVFYKDGYSAEFTIYASGYATPQKWDLQEAQIRSKLEERGVPKDLQLLEFQRIGMPQENPTNQLASTTALRIFAQAGTAATVRQVFGAMMYYFMQHFPGMHFPLDLRLTEPIPFVTYFPILIPQSSLRESIVFLPSHTSISVGPPKRTEPLSARDNFDPPAVDLDLSSFGPTRTVRLGDVAYARSGDKGANANIGLFVRSDVATVASSSSPSSSSSTAADDDETWDWFRRFMTRARMRQLMGRDWRDGMVIERVEFPHLRAVHFVIYGALGKGVSSSPRVDCLGKGFAEFIRFVHVPVPVKFLGRAAKTATQAML